MKLTVGSLFAGIGGFDLGLERTGGFEIKWQVEIDEYCRRVLEKHWPHVKRYGDIREVTDVERVDVLCGGFPCQPVSLAGDRLGQADKRWLWPEFARIIRMVRPQYVLVENTPGLLSLGMGDVLGDMAGCGYDTEWGIVSASDMGAPHLRKRIWVVAYPAGARCSEGLCGTVLASRNGTRRQGSQRLGADVADSDREGLPESRHPGATQESAARIFTRTAFDGDGWWATEPNVGRVAHGIPARVDRLKGLGNAVVPQIVEWIGSRILETERREQLDMPGLQGSNRRTSSVR